MQDFEPGHALLREDGEPDPGQAPPDTAALRRGLVDEELMDRDHGEYWRIGGPVDTDGCRTTPHRLIRSPVRGAIGHTLRPYGRPRSATASCPIPTSTTSSRARSSGSTRRATGRGPARSTQRATGKAEVKTLVKEELDKFKLPITFSTAATDRVLASLTKQKFGTYQSLVLPATAVKWPASDRVTLPTASGKRTIKVYLDPGQGQPAAAARRQGDRARVPQRRVRARRRVRRRRPRRRRCCPGTAIDRRRMSRILLVRHGQSTWNADGRWQGRADPPLSDLGRRQAEVAAEALAELGITRVVASPLVRAHETATIVGAALGLHDRAPTARLQERDAGEWTGKTRAEIEAGLARASSPAAAPGRLRDRRHPPRARAGRDRRHRRASRPGRSS